MITKNAPDIHNNVLALINRVEALKAAGGQVPVSDVIALFGDSLPAEQQNALAQAGSFAFSSNGTFKTNGQAVQIKSKMSLATVTVSFPAGMSGMYTSANGTFALIFDAKNAPNALAQALFLRERITLLRIYVGQTSIQVQTNNSKYDLVITHGQAPAA